ncbi:MAG TPA: extracellular solute-binding protein [Chloroflexota bacterium]|nr:extracellular solute-binding protein [Chloroflexota bacterium]
MPRLSAGLFAFVASSTLLLAACAPAAAPSPTAAPAKPTAAPEKPAAAAEKPAPAAEKPAEKAASAAPAPKADAVAAKLDEYYQKAKASGEMSIVQYGPGPEYQPFLDAFKEKFPGTSAETVNLRGIETFQRIGAEAASGRHIANIVWGGATSLYGMDQQGYFVEWEGPPTRDQLPQTIPPSKARIAVSQNMFGVVVNTSLVPADKMPTKREDLLDPFWKGKGKLLFEDPRGNGPGTDWFTVTYDDLGQEWMEKLKAQEPTFVRDRDAAPAQVARGEYALFLPVNVTSEILGLEKNAPVKIIWLREGSTTGVISNVGLVKNAPGQDVGKLWISFALSEEGQKILGEKVGVYGVLPGAPPPAGWPTAAEVKPKQRTADQIERSNEYVDNFDKIFFK